MTPSILVGRFGLLVCAVVFLLCVSRPVRSEDLSVALTTETVESSEIGTEAVHTLASTSRSLQRQRAFQAKAVSLCMHVLGDEIDFKDMRKLKHGLEKQIQLVKSQLEARPDSRKLKNQLKCLRKARHFHSHALHSITKYIDRRDSLEKEADKIESDLLNLPCDLEEGDHVEKCESLKCQLKGTRKRAENAQKQANTWYRIQILHRRIHRYQVTIARIKKEKKCPSRRVDVYHHNKNGAVTASPAALVETGTSKRRSTFEEDWVICLDRAEYAVNRLKVRIGQRKQKLKKLKAIVIPLTCTDKKPPKYKVPPKCPIAPPPPPPPRHYKHHRHHRPFHHRTACASGDPHVDTFDGLHHDTMIAGWFTWVQNPVITVQGYSQLGCMPVSIPNTCLRAITVRITPPGSDEVLIASWGIWPPTGHVQNVVIQDSFGRNVNVHPHRFSPGLFLNNKFHISWGGGQFHIRPHGASVADPNLAVSVTFGTYYLAVTLPNAEPHIGATNGLMGFYSGDMNRNHARIFRYRNGQHAGVDARALCQRCGWGGMQTPTVMRWAASHVVGASNPPIGVGQGHLKQQRYLNGWHGDRRHHSLVEANSTADGGDVFVQIDMDMDSMALMDADAMFATAIQMAAEMDAQFDPFPKETKPVIMPSFVPKVSPKKLRFCRNKLRRVFKMDKSKKPKPKHVVPWWSKEKCLPPKAHDKVEKELAERKKKRDIKHAAYHTALNACLQDADAPAVANTVVQGQKMAKKQAKSAKKQLVKVVRKERAKERAIKRAAKREEQNKERAAKGLPPLPPVKQDAPAAAQAEAPAQAVTVQIPLPTPAPIQQGAAAPCAKPCAATAAEEARIAADIAKLQAENDALKTKLAEPQPPKPDASVEAAKWKALFETRRQQLADQAAQDAKDDAAREARRQRTLAEITRLSA